METTVKKIRLGGGKLTIWRKKTERRYEETVAGKE